MGALAAIDIGTNSTRLLLARPGADGGLEVLERLNTITRLGQGVAASGRLAGDAVERTLACLTGYRAVMDEVGATKVRVAAARGIPAGFDREEFFDRVEAIIGSRPELISGEEEGRLSFAGATSGLAQSMAPFLVVDIGGGSTEVVVGHESAEAVVSLEVGCVRLTESLLHHDPPQPEELSAAISLADTHLEDAQRVLPGMSEARTVVGLAGTVTTVAAVELGVDPSDRDAIHHFELTREAAEDVFRTLATEPLADRVHNPGLERARADVIVGGCCVLVAFFRRLGLDRILVSEADILDGLALSLGEGSAAPPLH